MDLSPFMIRIVRRFTNFLGLPAMPSRIKFATEKRESTYMTNKRIIAAVAMMMTASIAMNAQNTENEADKKESRISNALGRLTIGGYGEAVMSRNFYSSISTATVIRKPIRTTNRMAVSTFPHVTLNLGYDFGKAGQWGMEIDSDMAEQNRRRDRR